jgi:hypothetical protein
MRQLQFLLHLACCMFPVIHLTISGVHLCCLQQSVWFKLLCWSKCISVLGSLWTQFLHQTVVRYCYLVQATVSSSGGIKAQFDINVLWPHSFCVSHQTVYVAPFWNHFLHTRAVLFSQFVDGSCSSQEWGRVLYSANRQRKLYSYRSLEYVAAIFFCLIQVLIWFI